jgi:isoleucyl-tRNA synthetase
LGQQYGPKVKEIAKALTQWGSDEINQLEREQHYELPLNGEAVSLTLEDVEISSEDIPGWSVAREGNLTVALDITVTDALKKEGVARDLVNRIQNLRKDQGLEVQDKIEISVKQGNALVDEAIQAHKAYICQETQAVELTLTDDTLSGAAALEMDEGVVKLVINVVR